MNCGTCGTALLTAQFYTGSHGVSPYLSRKRGKGAFEPVRRSGVDCFVCPVCGKIEFYAQDAQNLLFQ